MIILCLVGGLAVRCTGLTPSTTEQRTSPPTEEQQRPAATRTQQAPATEETKHRAFLPSLGGQSSSPISTPTPSGPTPLPPPAPKPNAGIQVHLLAGDMEETLQWAQGLGVGWIKQQVEWHTIEHGPGDYDWALLDNAVNAAHAAGFKVLLSVTHAPDWTRAAELESGPPTDYTEFGRFMGQLATRYRGRVAAYELWNEPNLAREWRGDSLDSARFVALLAEGAAAVQEADPEALIISGAPAVTGIDDGVTAVDDRRFLRGMVAAGIPAAIDGIGAHPYGFANPPQASWQDAEQVAPSHNDHPSFFFRDTLEDYRAILTESGDERPIWPTEFGWPSVENMGTMDTEGWAYARDVSEAEQAAYVVAAYGMGAERPWVGPMFLWNLNLAPIWGPENPTSAYSVLRPDGSYRPAYIALRLATPRASETEQ